MSYHKARTLRLTHTARAAICCLRPPESGRAAVSDTRPLSETGVPWMLGEKGCFESPTPVRLATPSIDTYKSHSFADFCGTWCKRQIYLVMARATPMSTTGNFKASQMNRFLNRKNPLGYDYVINTLQGANFWAVLFTATVKCCRIDSWMNP